MLSRGERYELHQLTFSEGMKKYISLQCTHSLHIKEYTAQTREMHILHIINNVPVRAAVLPVITMQRNTATSTDDEGDTKGGITFKNINLDLELAKEGKIRGSSTRSLQVP